MEYKIFTSGEENQSGMWIPVVFFGGISIPVSSGAFSSKASATEMATNRVNAILTNLFKEKI